MKKNLLIGFLAIVTLVSIGWGVYTNIDGSQCKTDVENLRQRAFYDLIDAAEKLSVASSKLMVSTNSREQVQLLAELNTNSYVAQENLSQLPLYHNTLLRTEKFLNQMGDFSYSLFSKAMQGEGFSSEEEENLASLNTEVSSLQESLIKLSKEEENPFSWRSTKAAAKNLENNDTKDNGVANTSLTEVSANLEEIPALIYDGPFSDDLENKASLELKGEETTWNQIIANAKGIFGSEYEYEAYGKSGRSAGIAVYTLEISQGKDIVGYFDFTKIGGYPLQYTAEGKEGNEQFTVKQALASAKTFIDKTAYQNMKSVYYYVDSNILTVNYIATENNTAIYPDMIKVSVDLTTNEITGFDAKTYLENHKERSLKPTLTFEDARKLLKSGVVINGEQLAVIPLKNGEEALCYEFKIAYGDYHYLQYFNALTGQEEDILRIISTDNGTYTI